MIIEYSVENFKSIKEEQILSLVKNSSNEYPHNYFDSKAPVTPELLKTAVIYGANASGKTSLLKSLFHMQEIIEDSFKKDIDEPINVIPFRFCPISRVKPTTFNIIFVVNLPNSENIMQPTKVEYGFSADQKIVFEEWLSVYPKSREQSWFHRIYDEEKKEYKWTDSAIFKGEKSTWKKNTRSDQLFLSTAVHLNSEQLKPIYNALTDNIKIVGGDRIDNKVTKEACKSHGAIKELILSLLKQADIDVQDIIFKKPNIKNIKFPKGLPVELQNRITKDILEEDEVYFVHTDSQGGKVEIVLSEESDGTQKIFEFASLIFLTLGNGGTLVIDEFNKSLHPDLVRYLVKIFNSKENFKNGQLIFTTHETSILRKDLLRRDQIWFCEKNKLMETNLYPLTDFSPHKERDDIEECYLYGRYGGKPIIDEFQFPIQEILKYEEFIDGKSK